MKGSSPINNSPSNSPTASTISNTSVTTVEGRRPPLQSRSPLSVVDLAAARELNRQYIAEVEALRREYQINYRRYQVNLHEDERSMSRVDKNTITEIIDLPKENLRSPAEMLKRKRYKLVEEIGEGAYGTVWRASYQLSPSVTANTTAPTTTTTSTTSTGTSPASPRSAVRNVAVKVMTYDRNQRQRLLSCLKAEVYVLEKYPHPNIITLYDHFVIDDKAYLIMEFADGGSLYGLLRDVKKLKEPTAYEYFVQILKGVLYLHSFGIAHRDLKTDNVLLVNSKTEPGVKIAKITDFGLSRQMYKRKVGQMKAGSYAGTKSYMAPEILCCDIYPDFESEPFEFDAFKADVWALGVLLYELLCGDTPFRNLNSSEEIYKAQFRRRWSFPREPKLTENVKALIRSLLQPNPYLRIDPTGILSHPWIQCSYITNRGWTSARQPSPLVAASSPNTRR